MNIQPALSSLPSPEPGDRVVALGNTGEGKSVLFRSLLQAQPNVIIVNTKHDPDFEDIGRVVKDDERIFRAEEGRFDFRPSDEWTRSREAKDRFFAWALKEGNRVIYCDEFDDICDSAQTFPFQLKKCVKQGRWKSLGIWGSAQEPIRVPSFLFGQAQHRYVFHLGWEPHRKVAEEFFQHKIPWESIPERSHRFFLKTPQGTFGPQPPIRLT